MILIDLFLTFLKIGAFTFGGGYAMLPLIQSEVERHGWLTQAEVIDFIAISESTPGPLAINMATFIGIRTGDVLGAVCATSGVVLPSFVIILIVAKFYDKFRKNKIVDGMMYGLRPAVIGLISTALLSVGTTVFFNDGFNNAAFSTPVFLISLGIFVLGAVLAFKKLHPIAIISISAAIGIITGYVLGI
ncbi:chromate transporter [Ruminococcus albus]|uniref:Chromate transporter n=1 Tax=Ruminococcus albus (strain ATCC 27210 / DSM 20455 / JCM 14654 / NCDO 2250 / 7) TaxID=697329 RepID=E6UAD2_RUMA7|nr:chromate transporter [Ruminococcus albus]ADU22354.1 Chromate transporter [Ruminococcus albus 7 = DSM 20455]